MTGGRLTTVLLSLLVGALLYAIGVVTIGIQDMSLRIAFHFWFGG